VPPGSAVDACDKATHPVIRSNDLLTRPNHLPTTTCWQLVLKFTFPQGCYNHNVITSLPVDSFHQPDCATACSDCSCHPGPCQALYQGAIGSSHATCHFREAERTQTAQRSAADSSTYNSAFLPSCCGCFRQQQGCEPSSEAHQALLIC
jgi:hypothetical protein